MLSKAKQPATSIYQHAALDANVTDDLSG